MSLWFGVSTVAVGAEPEMVAGRLGQIKVSEATSDGHRRVVAMRRPYALAAREVTQAEWRAVFGTNPSADPMCSDAGVGDDLPVHCVSWFDAVLYANELSVRHGLESVYLVKGADVEWNVRATGYRLPTEAEWEAAAGPGANRFGWPGARRDRDLCAVGNLVDRAASRSRPGWVGVSCNDGFFGVAPVGSFRASESGLYDMVGNVREWTWDVFEPFSRSAEVDPSGPEEGPQRTARGGAWCQRADDQAVGRRSAVFPTYRGPDIGVRLARYLDVQDSKSSGDSTESAEGLSQPK